MPSTVNGFLLKDDMETVFDFYIERYHSQFDTPDTYNEAVMKFNISYYGALALYIDRTPALYLDFTAQYDRLQAAIDEELMAEAGVDVDAYRAALEALGESAAAMIAKVEQLNADYAEAEAANDAERMQALWAEGRDLTKQNLEAFRFAQTGGLLGLMYERPIVPHEAPQENVALSREIISLLEAGDVQTAVDDSAWSVNNVLEWYAMYFSPEVIAIQDDMLWGEGNADNLYWGTDKGFVKADVDAATRSLFLKYDEENADFSDEIAVYSAAIEAQQQILLELCAKETEAIQTLADMLK